LGSDWDLSVTTTTTTTTLPPPAPYTNFKRAKQTDIAFPDTVEEFPAIYEKDPAEPEDIGWQVSEFEPR
jgi:hypothetical protein